jgi:hypothetical protein
MQRMFFIAFAALVAFFASTRSARADERPHGVAAPDTYAARYGAPLCDSRAASSYAEEPSPTVDDSVAIAASNDPVGCVAGSKLCGDARESAQHQQLESHCATAIDLGIPVVGDELHAAVLEARVRRPEALGAERDGHPLDCGPAPRPLPWLA